MSPASARVVSIGAVLATAALGLAIVGTGFMMVMPALVMVLPLVCGRYPGERVIERARRAVRAVKVAPVKSAISVSHELGWGVMARGGRLIASSLATRPPPCPVQ